MATTVQNDPRVYGYQAGKFGTYTINPTRVQPSDNSNSYGINIPKNIEYTTDGNGNQISLGQDGYQLAHRDPSEFKLHVIA